MAQDHSSHTNLSHRAGLHRRMLGTSAVPKPGVQQDVFHDQREAGFQFILRDHHD